MRKAVYRIGRQGSPLNTARERVIQHLNQLEKEDLSSATFEVVIKPYKKNRSVQQNKYLWGVVYPAIINDENGMLFTESLEQQIAPLKVSKAEVVHELCKHKFLPKVKTVTPSGEVVVLNATTAKLNAFEFQQYVENIQMWAMQTFGIDIPTPNQAYNEPQAWWDAET